MCNVEANKVIYSYYVNNKQYVWIQSVSCQQYICRTRIANWKVDYEIYGRIFCVWRVISGAVRNAEQQSINN